MNLYFGVTIAPYAVDFCNALHERFHCRIFHRETDVADLAFDPSEVQKACRFPFERYPSGLGFRAFRMLSRLVKEEKPEYVFTSEFSLTTLRFLLIRLLTRQRFRIISVCDDSLDMILGNDFSRLHRAARHHVPRLVDNLILANPDSQAWYREHFGKGLLMPILSDERRLREEFEAALPLSRELRRQYGLETRPVLLFVGRLIPLKNLPFLLEAAAGLDATLVFVGDGPEEARLKAIAAEKGITAHFVGRKTGEPLAAWFNLADLLVLPSLQEAFGAVTGEALSAGCPVLVSTRAGSASLIRKGVNGDTADPTDQAAWHSALTRFLPSRPHGLDSLRENLLPLSFDACFTNLIQELLCKK